MSILHRPDKAAAFEALAAQHERMLYLLCLRMMGSHEDAQDCAQEALLRAYRAFDRFREQASAKTWLYRITYNTCLDALRKRKAEVSLEAMADQGFDPAEDRVPGPEEAFDRQELRRQIGYALTLLPPDQRAVMILRDFQQMPYDGIAAVLEINEGTVKSRLSRAREKIKNYLISAEQIRENRVQANEGRQK